MTDLSVLDRSLDDVKSKSHLPDGDYVFRCIGTDVSVNGNGNPLVDFKLEVSYAADKANDIDLTNIFPVKGRLFLTDNALAMYKDTLEHCFGVDPTGMSIAVSLEETLGKEVRGLVKQTTVNDRTYVNVDRFLRPVQDETA